MAHSQDSQGDCGIRFKKEEGHTTINYRGKVGKVGECTLIQLVI